MKDALESHSDAFRLPGSRIGDCVFSDDKEQDVIDEALYFFKANVFFKNYEVKVGTD